METSNEKRTELFKDELKLIYDEGIREFTKLCLIAAPNYFFLDCPSSSSGRYHPINELGVDGIIIHSKRVFTVAYELCRGLGCEDKRDQISSACIIHDLRKMGLTRSGHTVKNHPGLAADLVEEVQTATQMLSNESYNIIRNCVGYHYGPWSISPWSKKLSEYTIEEMTLYISDYIASKRCISVDYRR